MNEKFTWLPFFEELLDIICNKYNPYTLYKEFKKLVPEENYTDIDQIDPLTFIGCICGGSDIIFKRSESVRKSFNMQSAPIKDAYGIPSFPVATYKYFHEIYEEGRNINEIMQILWDFSKQTNKNEINEDDFNNIVKNFKDVKLGKLSQIMFIVKPNTYYSCDTKSLKYLNLDIKDKEKDYAGFLKIQECSQKTGKTPFELSYIAHIYSEKRKKFLEYLEPIQEQNHSYIDFIQKDISEGNFERKIYNITFKRIYDINTEKELDDILKLLKNDITWKNYDKNHGNGIPHAILNTHYRNYLKGITIDTPNDISAWLLSWNPDKWIWNNYEDDIEKIRQKIEVKKNWSCISKHPKIGDRFFLLKLGSKDPKGIIASGYITSESFKDTTEYRGDNTKINHIEIKFDKILNYNKEDILSQKELKEKFPGQEWSPQASGIEIKKTYLNELEHTWKQYNNKESNEVNMREEIKINSLNLILYGPPGTGKTFKTKELIEKITKDNKRTNNLSDMKWYDLIALAMYNNKQEWTRVPQLRQLPEIEKFAKIKNTKNFDQILWGQLQNHTSPEIMSVKVTNRSEPFLFEKDNDSNWRLTSEGRKYVEDNLLEYIEANTKPQKVISDSKYFKFITFHQSYSYEDFIEGIKPNLKDNDIKFNISNGIFKKICLKANEDPKNKYLIIIDEINRGNISKIFGELITLIEEDKRVIPNGEKTFENTQVNENQMLVTLPYSQEKFGVPQNLYIIGTMNTSDRSIASIDIALRRRFKFKEIMPDSNLVADFGVKFEKTFKDLNKKIKLLLDRDHQIGHSYFINTKYKNENNNNNLETLKDIWFSEILPLLNEYFYCDWEKLKLIVPGFIKKIKDIPQELKDECENSAYEFKTYEDFKEEADFEAALKQDDFKEN